MVVESAELALVISDLGSGGAQRVLVTLANAWAKRERRICVITLADESRDFFYLHPSVRRLVSGGMRDSRNSFEAIWMNLRRIVNLRRRLRECGAPTVVSFVGTTNILSILACLGFGIRVVISERNDPSRQSLGRFWDVLRRKLYPFAYKITANSRGALEALSVFVPACKLAFVPNPLSIPEDEIPMEPHSPTVLAVGRLHRQKAYDILLPAFAKASEGLPDWRLSVLGVGGLKEELQELAMRLKISDRVDWHGRTNDPFQFYRNSDVFVLASRHEGMPNAMLEAMACGLPAIVTDASPGPLEYVTDGETGLVAPVEDIDALASALRRLMADPDLRERLGRRAKERVSDCELSHALKVWESAIGLSAQSIH